MAAPVRCSAWFANLPGVPGASVPGTNGSACLSYSLRSASMPDPFLVR
jgi:hypothetical protein